MKKIILFIFILLFPAVVLAQTEVAPNSAIDNKVVKAIEVRGNKTIGMAPILSKIKTRVEQEYLQSVISDDIKRLYNMGYFSNVSVDREEYNGGFRVVFYVVEKSIVKKISFSRIRNYKPRYLMRKMKTKEGKFLDKKSLSDDLKIIRELYEKKGLSNTEVSVEEEFDELHNKISLHFVIREGRKTRIKKLRIKGNQAFRSKKILRIVKTRPDTWFTSGFLKEDVLDEDMERIRGFYEKEGFIDASASYELDEVRPGRLYVNINISEGKQYFVEKVTFAGNEIVLPQELADVMENIKAGNVFSREKLGVDLSMIRSLYFDKGYIFANVRESISLNQKTGKVDIKVDIQEGNLAYVNNIKIQGNERTRDVVVRRELRLYPGDQFDGAKLRRSKQRLRNLGYFKDISYDTEDTDLPDHKDLVVQVTEAKTGSFSFGGGYSTVDQMVGFLEIQQKNFDFTNWPTFTGGGQHLSARAETGSTRNNMRLSFTEPWINGYPISGGFDLYASEKDREKDVGYAFDEKRNGLNIRFGKEFSEYVSGGVNWRYERIDIGNFEDNVSAALLAEEGKNNISSFGMFVTKDKRDNVFNPTKGWLLSASTDLAGGPFGGTKDFYRLQTRGNYYVPFKFNSVLEFRARAGVVDDYGDSSSVPIFERFFAGGARSIRGYDERKVGPLDSATNDPTGGESMFVGNIEYTVPLVDFIKLAAFFDTGNVWPVMTDFGTGGLKSGVGLGFRVKTPIGPINLDYGYPLDDEPGEDEKSGKFYFSVSRGF